LVFFESRLVYLVYGIIVMKGYNPVKGKIKKYFARNFKNFRVFLKKIEFP
jgi:hypothetical protein